MKIALLQLDPTIGHVARNIEKADMLIALHRHSLEGIDLLVLPELAFTGYNFPHLESIKPYLEKTASGESTKWAIETARRLQSHVIVGYPETSTELDEHGEPINYNATITIAPDGQIVATYRKSFLYYTDECWASEGSGFYCGPLGTLGTVAHGICMDINPRQFTAPWAAYEFANHCLAQQANLIVLSTAWLTHTPLEVIENEPTEPDMSTLSYWIERFQPLLTASGDKESIVVFANRCGSEPHLVKSITAKTGQTIEFSESSANYAGSSCVMRFGCGMISIQDFLGQGEENVLVVDTSLPPKYKIRTKSHVDEAESV